MTGKELLNDMTINQAEDFAEAVGYLFGPEETECVIKILDDDSSHTIYLKDIDSANDLMELLKDGYSAIPF